MYKPDNHTNTAIGSPLLKSSNNYGNINGRYTPDTAKISSQEHSKNWYSSQNRAELMGRREKTTK